MVRAAINKSCVGDVADAICCLLPGATLHDIKKSKWLYVSVESFDTLIQEFYQIVHGKSERVQTFGLHLEWALKVIKQQHPHTMTKEEGISHLKDQSFHGLKPNIHNALCYMYNKPDSQYRQLVMAAREAKTETPGSNVPEVRTKSAVVGANLQPKVASSDPPYEVIMQQITYLMSAITNQKSSKKMNAMVPNRVMEMVSSVTQILAQSCKDQKEIGKIGNAGDVGVLDTVGESVLHPDRVIISLLKQSPPVLSQHQPGRCQHQWIIKES